MEQERSYSGGFSAMFEDDEGVVNTSAPASTTPSNRIAGVPSIGIMAVLSVIGLVGVGAWSITSAISTKNTALNAVATPSAQVSSAAAISPSTLSGNTLGNLAATDEATDTVSQIAPDVISALYQNYQTLAAQGNATPAAEDQAASQIAAEAKVQTSYPTFSNAEIPTDPDTSYARMLAYRSALQTTLAPLLNNSQPEFEVFAEYVQTQDPQYLTELQTYAKNYEDAASATAKLVVPADAVSVQVGILNAMEEYASVLNAMAGNASDPIASAVLLSNEDQADSDTYAAFGALASYFANHSKS